MEKTPKSMRLHIAITGAVNAGKSSFLNLVSGQDISIVSDTKGTTTDVVEKTQELLPIGPVVWLDTAGFGDDTVLSASRLEKTFKVLDKADIAVLVSAGKETVAYDKQISAEIKKRNIPMILVRNKADLYHHEPQDGAIDVCSLDKSSRDKVILAFKRELIKICPDDFINTPTIFGDLVPDGGTTVLLVPIDKEAPKGRLILPQAQTIRDGLDHNQTMLVMQEQNFDSALKNLKQKPDLIICDSQIVDFMVEHTPSDIKCTTFSILFGRLKGDLHKFVEGAAAISKLKDGDKVLIAESCTHHAVEDDIGHIKIPRWLKQKTGADLQISYVAGCDFPQDLSSYKLVIQCGGCMLNRRQILHRINLCESAGVPITNYGICISELKGVLPRVLEPFEQIRANYDRNKEKNNL